MDELLQPEDGKRRAVGGAFTRQKRDGERQTRLSVLRGIDLIGAVALSGERGRTPAEAPMGKHQHEESVLRRADVRGTTYWSPDDQHSPPINTITAFADHGRATASLVQGLG